MSFRDQPAYPIPIEFCPDGRDGMVMDTIEYHPQYGGMTLHQAFAAAALPEAMRFCFEMSKIAVAQAQRKDLALPPAMRNVEVGINPAMVASVAYDCGAALADLFEHEATQAKPEGAAS